MVNDKISGSFFLLKSKNSKNKFPKYFSRYEIFQIYESTLIKNKLFYRNKKNMSI